MPRPIDITLLASTDVTSSGQGESVDLRPTTGDGLERRAAVILVDATALTGILEVQVQTSPSGGAWKTLEYFYELTAAGYTRLAVCPLERYVRIAWRLDSGAATISVQATAETILADVEDFKRWGLPWRAWEDLEPKDAVVAALLARSTEAYGAVPSRWRAALVPPFPHILRQWVCELAASDVLAIRGYDPDDAANRAIIDRATKAEEWLRQIATGQITPPWVDDVGEDEEEPAVAGSYAVASDEQRGW